MSKLYNENTLLYKLIIWHVIKNLPIAYSVNTQRWKLLHHQILTIDGLTNLGLQKGIVLLFK